MKQFEIVGLPIGHNDPLFWSRNRQDFITAREDDGTKGCQFETREEAEKEFIKAHSEWKKYNNDDLLRIINS